VYTQDFNPVSDSLGLSAIFAALPVLTLFVLLGGFKLKAQWAALISLAVAMLVALIVYGMPFGQTALSASEGAVFGFFPIMWIVIMAIWIYNMTVATGDFAVLRRSFGTISEDQRIQAVIIAFCFGALMEALAGFGTPVAISAVMLIGLGFRPIKAASLALVANTAPVAFGAIAIPIVTLSEITGLDKGDLGAMVGRQTPFLALIVPLILIGMVDGARGIRQTWPVASRSPSASSPARTSSRWRSRTSWRRSSPPPASSACFACGSPASHCSRRRRRQHASSGRQRPVHPCTTPRWSARSSAATGRARIGPPTCCAPTRPT
jgi:lactate permease